MRSEGGFIDQPTITDLGRRVLWRRGTTTARCRSPARASGASVMSGVQARSVHPDASTAPSATRGRPGRRRGPGCQGTFCVVPPLTLCCASPWMPRSGRGWFGPGRVAPHERAPLPTDPNRSGPATGRRGALVWQPREGPVAGRPDLMFDRRTTGIRATIRTGLRGSPTTPAPLGDPDRRHDRRRESVPAAAAVDPATGHPVVGWYDAAFWTGAGPFDTDGIATTTDVRARLQRRRRRLVDDAEMGRERGAPNDCGQPGLIRRDYTGSVTFGSRIRHGPNTRARTGRTRRDPRWFDVYTARAPRRSSGAGMLRRRWVA